jgi:Cu+-exporting ATPase
MDEEMMVLPLISFLPMVMAKETIDSLKSMRIEVVTLTGDNERTANAVASKLGIDRVIAQVLPQEKEQVIKS